MSHSVLNHGYCLTPVVGYFNNMIVKTAFIREYGSTFYVGIGWVGIWPAVLKVWDQL